MAHTFTPAELKPIYRQLIWNRRSSFNVKVDVKGNLLNSYHYHPERELILIRGSSGVRIIGSSVTHFANDDLVFIGKNVPHAFLHEQRYLDNSTTDLPKAIVVQFTDDFMGREFLELPELASVKHLFSSSGPGFSITGEGKMRIIPLMEQMLQVIALDRIIILLEILRVMVNKNSHKPLRTEGLPCSSDININERINQVIAFTSKNYDQDIRIEEVARIVNMTKESFCRYFKAQTGKTYIQFLLEFRINKACDMIREDQKSIKEIGYTCGFNSLSNFHYQFKKLTKLSPIEYKTRTERVSI